MRPKSKRSIVRRGGWILVAQAEGKSYPAEFQRLYVQTLTGKGFFASRIGHEVVPLDGFGERVHLDRLKAWRYCPSPSFDPIEFCGAHLRGEV